jgi:dipeptidyl aminopeptidase/acylaminoacyl peptidase
MKTAMHILIGIIALVLVLSFILVYANTHPPKYPLHVPPSIYKAAYEEVSFASDDGIILKGWLVKPVNAGVRSPAVIICHGIGANKSDFTGLAVSLSHRGYFVLQFDFRAHGESSGSRTSIGYHEQKDIHAALSFLKTRSKTIDPKRIGIFGFSMGGSTAILSAAKTGEFSAVVADSAFTSLRDQARETITGFYHLPTPVLIIAGEGDALVPADNGRRLYTAAKEPKELWVINGADHGGTMAAAGDEYEMRVGEFFDKNLR